MKYYHAQICFCHDQPMNKIKNQFLEVKFSFLLFIEYIVRAAFSQKTEAEGFDRAKPRSVKIKQSSLREVVRRLPSTLKFSITS